LLIVILHLGIQAPANDTKLTILDAYTYLGIASGNPWELKASIYSSLDFLSKKAE